MRLEITYKAGGGFSVEAGNEEDLMWLYNLANKTLWGNSAKVMTLEEADAWLGWKE